MNSFYKILDSNSVKQAVNDVMEVLVVEKLKEDYILCLDWDDIETAAAILTVIRYFTPYSEFKIFVDEVKDAGYTVTQGFGA